MPRQLRITLCREGWYYLVIFAAVLAGAMLREVNLLLLLAGMLAGPLLLSWRGVAVALRGLRVRRKIPQGVCAGDLLVVHVELENTRRRASSWAIEIEDQIRQPGEEPVRPKVFFNHVPAGQSRETVYRGRLTRRGRYEVGPMRATTRFPFGLLRRTITLGEIDALVVFPRLGQLTQRWYTRHHEAFEGAVRRQAKFSRVEGDFYGVRDWQQGDSRRWIHWRSSARRGGLVVRQFEQPRNRDVAVLVDLWQPEQPGDEDLDNVELAVSFAATVMADLCRKGGSNVLVGTTGTAPECNNGPASIALLQDVMKQLAVAEAAPDDGLPQLLATVLDLIEPGTEIILISPRRIHLGDLRRFAAVLADPARRALLRHVRTVQTCRDSHGRSHLEAFFRAE